MIVLELVLMITILQAIILGAIQGATEFLPVSSSGHLVLGAKILDIPTNLAAETLLNIGTILVIAIYFWPQIKRVIIDLLSLKSGKSGANKSDNKKVELISPAHLTLQQKTEVILKLSIGIIPAVLAGLIFGDFIETHLHSVNTVVVMLSLIGLAMIVTKYPKEYGRDNLQSKGSKKSDNVILDISYRQALMVGALQPVALVSGSSRSGVTMLAGIWAGMSIEQAASYSFLVGLPIIMAATFKFAVSSEGVNFITQNPEALIAGNVASFAVGLIAVKTLMHVVKKEGLKPFGIYRLILAALVLFFVIL